MELVLEPLSIFLFEIKDEALHQMDDVDENIDIVSQITASRNADKKMELHMEILKRLQK